MNVNNNQCVHCGESDIKFIDLYTIDGLNRNSDSACVPVCKRCAEKWLSPIGKNRLFFIKNIKVSVPPNLVLEKGYISPFLSNFHFYLDFKTYIYDNKRYVSVT